jgi:drug/metabolite transporter superfamily protein YnfA
MTDSNIEATQSTEPPTRSKFFAGRTLSDGKKIVWWREILIIAAVNVVYETVRNLSAGKPSKAYSNALLIIDWQRNLGIWHEQAMQQFALGFTPLIVAANYFYGSIYIAATLFTLVFLYSKFPDDYPLFRNTLMIGTLCALVGFALFPLMPPRLLDDTLLLQGTNANLWFGFIDTLVEYPTFWSFNDPAMKTISNQFAAMPSLHCGWAFWTFISLLPRMKSWWSKTLVVLYPVLTVYVVIITANHYVLDAVAGFALFTFAYFVARKFTRAGRGTPITTAN